MGAWSHLKLYSIYAKQRISVNLSFYSLIHELCKLKIHYMVVWAVVVIIGLPHTSVQQMLQNKKPQWQSSMLVLSQNSRKRGPHRDLWFYFIYCFCFLFFLAKPCRSLAETRSCPEWGIADRSRKQTASKPRHIWKNGSSNWIQLSEFI